MKENDVATEIVDAAVLVHRSVGPGLLESAYEKILAYELTTRGLRVERQVLLPIRYGALEIEEAYRLDLLVEGCVVVEIKASVRDHPVHRRQLLTYLFFSGKRLGLLLNFGLPLMKDGISRVVRGLR